MPSNQFEALRLDALNSLDILDSTPEPAFDQLTKLASDLFDVPIALISLIDEHRQWFKSCVGLDIRSTPRDVAFCDVAIRNDEVMIVADATQDPRFCVNPLVTGDPHISFYAGAPIRHLNTLIGTLCIIDRIPRPEFGAKEATRLAQLADAVSSVLSMRRDAQLNLALLKKQEETQKKLEMMEEVAGVGYWHLDLKDEHISWSKGVYAIHGADQKTYTPELTTAINWYHPDDRAKVAEALSRAVKTGEESEFELRIVRADGEVRKVYSRGSIAHSPDGQPASIFGVFTDITERHAAQQRLEESEARYRLLADRSNDIIAVYDMAGMFEYISPSIHTVLGYAPSDLIGKTVRDVIYPEDIEITVQAFLDYVAKKDWTTPFRVRYRAQHKDSRLLWLEAHPTAILDASGERIVNFQDVVRDVTDSVISREKLEASEAHLRLLADNVPGMVGYWDASLRCKFANQLYEEWFGKSPDEIVGATMTEIIEPGFFADNEPFAHRALIGERQSFERSHLKFSGERGYFWVQYIPDIDPEGMTKGFYVLATDVTDLKIKELALETTNAQLIEARKMAEAATEAKAQFLATMSHEIRTPLTTILGYANLLNDSEGLSDETHTFAKRIGKAGRALLGLVNDVLDVSRLDAGQVSLNPVATNLSQLVQDIVEQFQLAAAMSGSKLTLAIDEKLPAWLLIDDTRISQILNNLIGNACKFTLGGHIQVSIGTVKRYETTYVHVEVADSGEGLTEDQVASLFQRFYQADSGITRKHGGSGLGLAICREIVTLMAGEIGVQSEPGVGSKFWFEVPMIVAKPQDWNHDSFHAYAARSKDKAVLLVDDHIVNRQMIRTLIGPYVARVSEAVNGAEAIEMCQLQRFDLILMDIQMPHVDGVTAAKTIRLKCPNNSETPIVALTAMNRSTLLTDFSETLFTEVVAKPIDPKMFWRVVNILSPESLNIKQKEAS